MENSMQPCVLSSAPAVTDFTPLAEHEASTPASFFSAKPVLHAAIGMCDLLVAHGDAKKWEVFRQLVEGIVGSEQAAAENSGAAATVAEMLAVRGVSGFVTSSSLILNNAPMPSTPKGNDSDVAAAANAAAISIPYPCISLHAIQRLYSTASATQPAPSYSAEPAAPSPDDADPSRQTQALYLQLDMDPSLREHSNADTDADEDTTVELLLVPQTPTANGTQQPRTSAQTAGNGPKVKELFEALSRCADLHPDPAALDDDDGAPGGGGLAGMLGFGGGGMPGEGGWITSENAHEFEGQFGQGGGEEEDGLGPGAGSRRTLDEADGGEEGGEEGRGGDGEDTKWQRTG